MRPVRLSASLRRRVGSHARVPARPVRRSRCSPVSLCDIPAPGQSGPAWPPRIPDARALPPDDSQLRQEARSNDNWSRSPGTAWCWAASGQPAANPDHHAGLLRLKGQTAEQGRDPGPGADPVRQRRQSLKKPVYDTGTRTLTLNRRWRSTRRCSTCCATRRSIASSSPIPTAMSGRTCTHRRGTRAFISPRAG